MPLYCPSLYSPSLLTPTHYLPLEIFVSKEVDGDSFHGRGTQRHRLLHHLGEGQHLLDALLHYQHCRCCQLRQRVALLQMAVTLLHQRSVLLDNTDAQVPAVPVSRR